MKIIDIGICKDNVDPKGLGRIRVVRYNDYVGEKEKSIEYEAWGNRDPFLATPFLPNNINVIPEKGQAVKILNYNTEKETVNQEYIAGPFTTMHDFNSQSFTQQIENTTYGIAIKERPDIINPEDDLKNEEARYAFAKKNDYAIYGKYGSDVLFTQDGMILRGGKLLSKNAASPNKRKLMLDVPLMSKKSSRLYLKKFPTKAQVRETVVDRDVVENQNINFVIEYDVDNLLTPTILKFYVYKIINTTDGSFLSSNFNQNSPLLSSNVKLINNDNTTTTPTITISISNVEDCYKEARDVLMTLHEKNLNTFDLNYTTEDLHPFYFRPINDLLNRTGTSQEIENKITILKNIKVFNIGPSNGLIWSKTYVQNKPKTESFIDKVFEYIPDSPEQTFSTLVSDKIYLLSTDPNKSERTVPFEELDKYEFTQQDYIEKIDTNKNTFSMVRGDALVKIVKAMYDVLTNHSHNVVGPYVKKGDKYHRILEELMKTIDNDVLNNSIKIN